MNQIIYEYHKDANFLFILLKFSEIQAHKKTSFKQEIQPKNYIQCIFITFSNIAPRKEVFKIVEYISVQVCA